MVSVDEELAWRSSDVGEHLGSYSMVVGNGSVDRRGWPADRSTTGVWKAAPIISATKLCERIGTLGIIRNLVTYLTVKMHISNPVAANTVANFIGANYLTPLLGGFVADAYLGKYWSVVAFSIVQIVGMAILTLSVLLPSIRPSPCPVDPTLPCKAAHGWPMTVFYIAIYLIALGNGGLFPNLPAFGADQFDVTDQKEKQQMTHFFNWFYFCVSLGSLISVVAVVYIQDHIGYEWGFGIPSVVFVGTLLLFIVGTQKYRFRLPTGSPLTSILQVLVAAFRNRKLKLPADDSMLYDHVPLSAGGLVDQGAESQGVRKPIVNIRNRLSFLHKAAIVQDMPLAGNKDHVRRWKLCTVTQVEEFKAIMSLLPIWATTCFVWTTVTQTDTISVEQGATMDKHMGPHFKIPPASMAVFELGFILIFLPFYDMYFVPLMRRFTGHPQGISTLKRIGVGIFFSIVSMVVSGLVEAKRLKVARDHGLQKKPKVTVPISIFWLVPQYVLRGLIEIFTQVGQLDFFYSEAPESMRSLSTGIYLSTIGIGHFLSSLLVTIVRKMTRKDANHPGWLTNNLNISRLDNFYYLLAIISFVNFLVYLLCAHRYTYKRAPLKLQSPINRITMRPTSVSPITHDVHEDGLHREKAAT